MVKCVDCRHLNKKKRTDKKWDKVSYRYSCAALRKSILIKNLEVDWDCKEFSNEDVSKLFR